MSDIITMRSLCACFLILSMLLNTIAQRTIQNRNSTLAPQVSPWRTDVLIRFWEHLAALICISEMHMERKRKRKRQSIKQLKCLMVNSQLP